MFAHGIVAGLVLALVRVSLPVPPEQHLVPLIFEPAPSPEQATAPAQTDTGTPAPQADAPPVAVPPAAEAPLTSAEPLARRIPEAPAPPGPITAAQPPAAAATIPPPPPLARPKSPPRIEQARRPPLAQPRERAAEAPIASSRDTAAAARLWPPLNPAVPASASAPPLPRLAAPAPPAISAGWRAALDAWLQSHRRYPDLARRRGEEGTVGMRFTVTRDGRVLDSVLERASGSDTLDRAALEMVRDARLPPFPDEMTQGQISVSVNIRYRLAS